MADEKAMPIKQKNADGKEIYIFTLLKNTDKIVVSKDSNNTSSLRDRVLSSSFVIISPPAL